MAKYERSDAQKVVLDLNKHHAAVMLSGSFAVLNEVKGTTGSDEINFSRVGDFKNLYSNKILTFKSGEKTLRVSHADVWLKSKDRRGYKGVVFAPGQAREFNGYYNLYRGLAVEPKKGSWKLFRNHIHDVIADGDEDRFRWLVQWMARIATDTGGERPGVAVVLRGGQGIGKGFFLTNFGRIFGQHFKHLSNPIHFIGRFNSHLRDAVLVFCDEGFLVKDKSSISSLKTMITEKYIFIEQKYFEPYRIKNFINVAIASNHEWIVPAELDERRFFVTDVSDKHQKDYDYFSAIQAELDGGGLSATLYDLRNEYDPAFNLRSFPRTNALLDQQVSSMDSVQRFWYERLQDSDAWEYDVSVDNLYNNYIAFCNEGRIPHRTAKTAFSKQLHKLCPTVRTCKVTDGDGRKNHFHFPEIDTARTDFEHIIERKIEWNV